MTLRAPLHTTLLLALAVLFAACHEAPGPEHPAGSAWATDAEAQRDVGAARADTLRIVTLGGPVTETVYALGLGDRVVGTDRSSLYPAEVLAKPRLSYFRQSSAEGILSLGPTLVVALEGLGPPAVVDQLRAAGVQVVLVPEVTTMDAAVARVDTLGRVLGQKRAAEAIVARMQDDLAEAQALRPQRPPRALFVYARGNGLVNVSGTGTAADLVLQMAGAENVVRAFEGFRPLTAEAVVAAAPEVIVIPERGLESLGGTAGLFRQPGLAQTPAGARQHVVAVDDALLLGLGPRVGDGVAALAEALAGLQREERAL